MDVLGRHAYVRRVERRGAPQYPLKANAPFPLPTERYKSRYLLRAKSTINL